MLNGFLYEIINSLVLGANYLNLVELFKSLARKLTPLGVSQEVLIRNSNIAIDIFVVLKWALVIFLWFNGIANPFWTVFVFYLVWSNLHTYFYYHLWKTDTGSGFERAKRRFVNLIQAVAFLDIAFGYLYATVFYDDFTWSNLIGSSRHASALLFSISQSFFIGSDIAHPLTLSGEILVLVQVAVAFIFVVILLAKSLPQEQKGENGVQK